MCLMWPMDNFLRWSAFEKEEEKYLALSPL